MLRLVIIVVLFVTAMMMFGFFVALLFAFVVHGLTRAKKIWPVDVDGKELDDTVKPWTLVDPVDWREDPEKSTTRKPKSEPV